MEARGVTKGMVNLIVKNGKALSQNGGNKFAFIIQDGVAVVSKEGKLVTAWGKGNFDPNMVQIVNKLFGK